ncbi:MAG: hypothetical protein R3E50_15305 [Halioglobus sp.]
MFAPGGNNNIALVVLLAVHRKVNEIICFDLGPTRKRCLISKPTSCRNLYPHEGFTWKVLWPG